MSRLGQAMTQYKETRRCASLTWPVNTRTWHALPSNKHGVFSSVDDLKVKKVGLNVKCMYFNCFVLQRL